MMSFLYVASIAPIETSIMFLCLASDVPLPFIGPYETVLSSRYSLVRRLVLHVLLKGSGHEATSIFPLLDC